MSLDQALQRAGDSVDSLIEAWKLNPHPRISALATLLPSSEIFTSLFTGQLRQVAKKLTELKVRQHPHLSDALERVLREPPWSSDNSRDVWTLIFKLVAESRDPRFLALAEELPSKWGMRADQKRWLGETLTNAVTNIPVVIELTRDQSALLVAIERDAFAAKPAPKRSTTIDFAAVYVNPSDDRPRLVLADAFLEQGEARGEFLSLQLGTEKTSEALKRERALLRAHAKNWLTPFGGSLGADVKWRRGFPAEGLVKFRDAAAVQKYGALPEWATFESLTWSPARSKEHRPSAGFIGPAFRHLLRADGPYTPYLLEGAWRLNWLRCSVADSKQFAALVAHPGLTHLKTLQLADTRLEVSWINSVKNWGSLEELGVPNLHWPLLIHLLAAVEPTPLKRFQLGNSLRFHREPNGALTRLEILEHTEGPVTQLQSLPEGLVSSVVAPPSLGWTMGWLRPHIERVIKNAATRTSIAKAASRHLALYTVSSMGFEGSRMLVSDHTAVRAVDTQSLEVLESCPARGGCLDPSGRDVLFLRDGREVVRFEFSTSSERVIFKSPSLTDLVRSPDGTRAALQKSGKVLVIDVATGELLFTCKGADPVFDAKGERLVVRDGVHVLHDLTKHTIQTLEGVEGRVHFLPDGRLAARHSRDPVCVWRKPGDCFSIATDSEPRWSLHGTTDGSRIVLVQPSVTQVFDGRNAKVLKQFPGGDCGLITPDGRLFVASGAALASYTLL